MGFELTDGKNGAKGNCIVVQGSDIYVAGRESDAVTTIAKYWKNGTPVVLGDGKFYSTATAICVLTKK